LSNQYSDLFELLRANEARDPKFAEKTLKLFIAADATRKKRLQDCAREASTFDRLAAA